MTTNTVETDYLALHRRIERLLDLGRSLGATDEQLRAALQGPLHPDRVNVPDAGRFPPLDPVPYLAMFTDQERFWQGGIPGPDDGPFCGAQISLEACDQIRSIHDPESIQGVTSCIMPQGHRRAAAGQRTEHRGLMIHTTLPLDGDRPRQTLYQWLAPARELGQVERS